MTRDFLKNFKAADGSELPKEVIDAIMAENGRDINAAKAPFADYDSIKQQLTDANKTIDGFKEMDIDGVKRSADEWKAKAEQAQKDADERVAAAQFDNALDIAILAAKAKNNKAVKALLDVETLRKSTNRDADITAALEAVRKDSAYLFDDGSNPPPVSGAGTGGSAGGNGGNTGITGGMAGIAGSLREKYTGK